MYWLLIFLAVYIALCVATAAVLLQSPFSENGFVFNMLFAPVYWWAAFRGTL